MKNKAFYSILFALVLFTSMLYITDSEAAFTPDLTVTRVSPNNFMSFEKYPKYVPGYSVTISNYGSGASSNSTLDFYIKTYDGKAFKRRMNIPAINAGSSIRVRFSMSNNTDGSLKEGYAVVNANKTFTELKYSNNIRKFTLKNTILLNSTKTVQETYLTASNGTYNVATSAYNSPLSNYTGINKMNCKITTTGVRDTQIAYIEADIPGYMHENVTMKAYGTYSVSGHPTSWNDTTCRFDVNRYYSTFSYGSVEVMGTNLETKNTIREPIRIVKQVWNGPGGYWEYFDVAANRTRNVTEYYNSFSQVTNTYNTTDLTHYEVHNPNIVSLKVFADTSQYYNAGWYISPYGTISSVKGLYGDNRKTAYLYNSTTFIVAQKTRDISSIGFEINGTDVKGFNNFKTLGFSPWTWKEIY